MTTQEVKNHYSLKKWASIIQECNASGLSTKQWCNQNGIQEGSYYYWLKKIREKSLELLPAIKAETSNQAKLPEIPVFTKVSLLQKQVSADVMISLNGLEISLNSTATPELIQTVLLAVKQLC